MLVLLVMLVPIGLTETVDDVELAAVELDETAEEEVVVVVAVVKVVLEVLPRMGEIIELLVVDKEVGVAFLSDLSTAIIERETCKTHEVTAVVVVVHTTVVVQVLDQPCCASCP